MDTATHSVLSRPELVTDRTVRPVPPESARSLAVTANYLLSEAGRKASLLAGGDGRALQQIRLEVPANRLHLVSVDAEGVARLKLRPRYEHDGDNRVIRVDAPPTYDTAPTVDELFGAASKNHELERAYQAQRSATRTKRRESEREVRIELAQAFLSDPNQRALVHPAPSPRRCYLQTEHGRLLFDVASDVGPARDLPPEAHRRFRADLRARDERNQQERAAQLALHEEKKRAITEWIAAKGTAEQQGRQAAGMLPMDEAVEAITEEAFAALRDHAVYARDGIARLQAHLRQFPDYADAVVTSTDLIVTGSNAVKATAAQWALVQELQAALPDAIVTLRVHKLSWMRNPRAVGLTAYGALVTRKVGPFTLRREYAAPGSSAEQSDRLDDHPTALPK